MIANTTTTSTRPVIAGDVGKIEVIVCDSRTGRTETLANSFDVLIEAARQWPEDCLVVCEATGGYETALLAAAVAAGRAAHRADARKVKHFIRSLGRLGKSDRIDAAALARYGEERGDRLPLWQPNEADQDALASLVRLRDSLVEQCSGLKRQLKAPNAAATKPHLALLLADLKRHVAAVMADIEAILARNAALAERVAIIDAIPGCGRVIAATLVALMPELGSLDRKQAAALAGVAPHPRQSGGRDGYRSVRGGRPEIKRCLFMAALVARRCNPELRAFDERLRASGKKPLVALTAVMRKLITIVNARLRDAARAASLRPA